MRRTDALPFEEAAQGSDETQRRGGNVHSVFSKAHALADDNRGISGTRISCRDEKVIIANAVT